MNLPGDYHYWMIQLLVLQFLHQSRLCYIYLTTAVPTHFLLKIQQFDQHEVLIFIYISEE